MSASGMMPSEAIADGILERLRAAGIEPERLENDSRRVEPGAVFVAYPGARIDGRSFIPEALRRGAAAVLWERAGFEWDQGWDAAWYSSSPAINLAVDHLQSLSGHLAHRVYACPSEKLRLIGLTGTNGKTTCSQWIAAALAAAGQPCAVIGTLGNGFPGALEASLNTTPDAIALHALLQRYLMAGARACAVEVSSIGLDLGRCNGARFEIAVFTNLSRDHLDYHGTMAAYAEAKRGLFRWPGLKAMVVNLDDPFGRELLAPASGVRRIGYTLADADVDASVPGCETILRVAGLRHSELGVRFEIDDGKQRLEFSAPVIGRYNVANLAAVAGSLLALGFDFAQLPALLAHCLPPAGRMQRYGGNGLPLVLVDYAHSPDALAVTLAALRPVADARGGRLACVFGCGGDRDPGKRPLMGEIAAAHADFVLLTSDNPRSEDPAAIIAAIAAGAPTAASEPDRALAIARMIREAKAADVILVAGKGHETYQEVAGVRHPFVDAEVVRQALAAIAADAVPGVAR